MKRANFVEWVLWALFSTTTTNQLDDWQDEIDGYVSAMETLMGHTFESGHNISVASMRLTLDPVVSVHRPLLWYSVS